MFVLLSLLQGCLALDEAFCHHVFVPIWEILLPVGVICFVRLADFERSCWEDGVTFWMSHFLLLKLFAILRSCLVLLLWSTAWTFTTIILLHYIFVTVAIQKRLGLKKLRSSNLLTCFVFKEATTAKRPVIINHLKLPTFSAILNVVVVSCSIVWARQIILINLRVGVFNQYWLHFDNLVFWAAGKITNFWAILFFMINVYFAFFAVDA